MRKGDTSALWKIDENGKYTPRRRGEARNALNLAVVGPGFQIRSLGPACLWQSGRGLQQGPRTVSSWLLNAAI